MKKDDECKIIQDLLPSYIDKITDDATNKFIEDHIGHCEECSKILKDMGNDIVLDKINEKKEINYLKKIRIRNRILISVISILMLIIVIGTYRFFRDAPIEIGEDGKPDYYNAFVTWITGENKIHVSEVTNVLIKEELNGIPDVLEPRTTITIITFNSKDICIGVRFSSDGYTEEELKEKYNHFIEGENIIPSVTNISIKDNRLVYSINYYTGKTKAEVMDDIYSKYDKSCIFEL